VFLVETLYYTVLAFLSATYGLFLLLLVGGSRKNRSEESLGAELPSSTVSIVIPTYNEAEVIGRRLENISELDFPRDRFEVLVVDSASTDGTPDIVSRFSQENKAKVRVRLLERPVRLGKADAINEAMLHSDSEYFLLTDADVTNPKQALSQLLLNLQNKKIGAASGIEIPVGESTFAGRIETGYKAIYTAIRMAEATTDTPFMCESEFSAYRREALKPLRPGCMCDDIELTVGLRSTGLRAVYDPHTLFFEQEAATVRPKLRHKFRRGMANQHAILRTSSVMFNKNFGRYGSVVFPFEFLTHIVSPILVTIDAGLLLALLFIDPLSGLLAITLSLLAAFPTITMLSILTRRFGTNRLMGNQGKWSWAGGAGAFLSFQIVLFASLVQLAVKGPKLNWEKISETRAPSSVQMTSVPEVITHQSVNPRDHREQRPPTGETLSVPNP
jgi:cellulose synthase/poly-beta-1,6-N-acetylglucosamine synthase-like glycosyltransferase